MADKFILFSLEDEKSKKLGEVISNPTCKKIVNLLAEKELSESDIARELGMHLNTVEYNLNKLMESGLIEKAKHWWSVKGKKIDTYKVANKLIVISPKKNNVYSKLKGIIPIVIISGILTALVAFYSKLQEGVVYSAQKSADRLAEAPAQATNVAAGASEVANAVSSSPIWIWFLIGSLIAIIAFAIMNWKKL